MAAYISYSNEMVNSILLMYSDGIGTCEIAKRLSVTRYVILKILKRNNINPKRITRPYKNFYNIRFFDEYSEASCYWAGFIMADGNIHTKRKLLQIALAKKDRSHLEKFANDIEFTGRISYYEKTNSCKITVSGKWFSESLYKNFGITNIKTFTTKFPNIPEEYIPSFIRGYFDGDGCITKSKKCDVINICGTYEFLDHLRDYFYDRDILVNNKTGGYPPIHKTRNIYSVSYNGKNAKKVLKIIYNKPNIYLDRKYDKYLDIK